MKRPSRDQSVGRFTVIDLSTVSSLPAPLDIFEYMFCPPPAVEVYRTRFPSGDHTGKSSTDALNVKRDGTPPRTRSTILISFANHCTAARFSSGDRETSAIGI